MTVKELIKALEAVPQELPVHIRDWSDHVELPMSLEAEDIRIEEWRDWGPDPDHEEVTIKAVILG